MSTVEKNPTGYKESCILGRIGKLPDEEGRLLVVHGLIDENVHFAHTEKLINSLISAGKPFQQLVCELFFSKLSSGTLDISFRAPWGTKRRSCGIFSCQYDFVF